MRPANAKDVLFGSLYGDERSNELPKRVQRELLTLTIPRQKAKALDFMKTRTEINATGSWQDSNSPTNNGQTENIVLEIEYRETAEEGIEKGIFIALSLINNLEIKAEILYGRMGKWNEVHWFPK